MEQKLKMFENKLNKTTKIAKLFINIVTIFGTILLLALLLSPILIDIACITYVFLN